jgi:hypothetical protein
MIAPAGNLLNINNLFKGCVPISLKYTKSDAFNVFEPVENSSNNFKYGFFLDS